MSKIKAIIIQIDTIENLNIVKFKFNDIVLTMMSLDLKSDIKVGVKVNLTIKATDVSIAKDFIGIVSDSNQIKTTIKDIDNGKLLNSIKLSIDNIVIESIITAESSRKMDLKIGDKVTAFIKASEISIEGIVK